MSELEEIRGVLREYLALEVAYKPIADDAARQAWLQEKHDRLQELRARLVEFASTEGSRI